MAFGLGDLALVRRLREQGYLPDGCAIAELGAQQINDSILDNKGDLLEFGKAFNAQLPCPNLVAKRPVDAAHPLVGLPMTHEIWSWLNFPYVAIDVDESPDCVSLDLNYDTVPTELNGRFHLVTNFGTTEHVANQLNAFKIIHDLTALGGVMIHNVPCHLPDHGLVNYTPKFFWTLARSNGYRLIYTSSTNDDLPAIVIALQKQHPLNFMAPIDVPTGSATSNEALRRRYPSVFDKTKMDAIVYSADAELNRRRAEAFEREQTLAKRERSLQKREGQVYEREQQAAIREEALAKANRSFHALRTVFAKRMPWLIPLKRRLLGRPG